MKKHFSTSSFVLGVMCGMLITIAWFWGGNGVPLVPPSSPISSSATSTISLPVESGALSVSNQPAGNTVIVESVTVPPPGVWVAVREMQGGSLGNVLGAAYARGPRSNFPVPLLRATEPDRSYAIELYRNDASGTFDFAKDSVYIDFNTGAPVIAYFTTVK